MPSATLEEYLETIYKLSQTGDVRPSRIADALAVSPPTVTSGLRRLEDAGLVTRPDGGVELTERGVVEAVAIVRRHRIAERFLVDVLGLPWDTAHDEACRLEHALSDTVLAALEGFLENPGVCPHGHPIPGSDGSIATEEGVPLTEVAEGAAAVISSVPEEGELLGYMQSLDLRPGRRVTLEQAAPFDGPLLIVVDGKHAAIDRAVARQVIVVPGD
ncbi:MAG TPA: metal-dependent transcriptional regulator [Coriobacteriia bacterium]